MSRPEIKIDWKRVDELLEAGCLGTEIAAHIGMHPETFYDRVLKEKKIGFTDYSTQKRSCGDGLIREAQYKKALKRLDNTMLIWLGKQRLGQKETPYETQVPEDIMKQFDSLMNQLEGLRPTPSTASAENSKASHSSSPIVEQ